MTLGNYIHLYYKLRQKMSTFNAYERDFCFNLLIVLPFHSYSNNTPKINHFSSTKTFPAVIFLSFVTVMFEKIGTKK